MKQLVIFDYHTESIHIYNIKEFNIVNDGFNTSMWFNHSPINDRSKTASINGYHFGNGTASPFKPMTDRNDGNYKLNCSGIASNANGISSGGTERFGQDYLYVASGADSFGVVGGFCSSTTYAGVWSLYLSNSLTVSSRFFGCSASLYPHMDIK